MKKKIIIAAIVAALCLTAVFALTACNNGKTDWEYIQDKGTITIGVTPNAPITIMDGKNVLPEGEGGFDTDMAYAVARKLGVKIEFQEIDWDSKVMEVESKAIDLIWNGMTRNSDLEKALELSKTYLKNQQVAVAKKSSAAAGLKTVEAINAASYKIAIEKGGTSDSTYDKVFANSKNTKIGLDKQLTALNEVKMGTSDLAICDLTMARSFVGNNSDCVILTDAAGETLGMAGTEYYAIAARKGDKEFIKKINDALVELYNDGTYAKIAARYDLTALQVEIK